MAALACLADAEQDLRQVEESWGQAVQRGDLSALDRMLADTLIYAHASGAVETKQQYLDRLRSGQQRYTSVTRESLKVVPHGSAVVTHSLMRMVGTSNGKPFNDHVMMLHVWVREGGTWRLAGHQTARLPQ